MILHYNEARICIVAIIIMMIILCVLCGPGVVGKLCTSQRLPGNKSKQSSNVFIETQLTLTGRLAGTPSLLGALER